jgi:hypothetical protein
VPPRWRLTVQAQRKISFLRHRRVELNAMPADVLVRFLARKLAERVRKVGSS